MITVVAMDTINWQQKNRMYLTLNSTVKPNLVNLIIEFFWLTQK